MGKSSTKAAKPAKVEAPVKAATKDKKMKDVSAKVEKKSKKAKKEPTPEPSDSSESEESASSESESSEEEVEVKKPVAKANGAKKAAAKKEESSDETSEGTSDESSEDEAPAAKKSKANGVGNLAAKQAEANASADESSSDEEGVDAGVLGAAPTVQEAAEDSDDSDESDSSEDEKPAKKAAAKPAAKDDDEEDEDSDDEDSSDEEEEKPASKAKDNKRKAEAEPEMPERAKKIAKADASENSGSKNLFVGNLSWNVDEAWLRQEFESFGELTGVRIMIDRATNRSKGFGYVEFANADDAAKAHAERKGYELDGRALNVDFANAKPDNSGAQADRRKQYGDQLSEPTATLFIGNISFEVGQEEVTSAFGEVASVVSCRLPTDQETGAPKGFGYIEFNSVEDATSALNTMQGHYLGNRPIRLDYSQPRPDRGDGGRGGGRGGFGGRGRGGDRGGRGGRGGSFGGRGGRGGFGDRGGRGGRGGARGGRGGSTNRGGFGDFSGVKQTFD